MAELKASYQAVQAHYFKAFADKGAAEDKIRQLEDTCKAQAARINSLESPFNTPVKSSLAASPPGEAPQLATMPVLEGGMFSAGGSTRISSGAKFQRQLRRTKAQEEAAFVPTNRGAFPFEELVPSKPAVESAAAVVEATTEAAVSVAAEEGDARAIVTAPATSEEALPEVAAALAGVEVAMGEPEAVPVGAEGGPPVTATAPAAPTVEEVAVPVAQPVVATQAPAAVTVARCHWAQQSPLCGGKGRPAERVPG